MIAAQQRLESLLPGPVTVTALGAVSTLPETCAVAILGCSTDDANRVLRALAEILPMPVTRAGGDTADVWIRLDAGRTEGRSPEAYRLLVADEQVWIDAQTPQGVVWALQTLRQLLGEQAYRARPADDRRWLVANCDIADEPRFAWRGILIDVARHFLPKSEMLKHIRVLSSLKFNRLQLHLTDCQGWRIESTRHPRLHEHGSWRAQTQRSGFGADLVVDGTPHGGYYTLSDLREIRDLAFDLGIELVPEIEFPGHSGALLAAYPELGSPAGIPREVLCTWGIHPSLVSPTEATVAVIEDIVAETLDAVPGAFLHLGGDEALIDRWMDDPVVVAEAAARGLTTSRAIAADLMARLERFAMDRGRRVIVWDDSVAAQQARGEVAPAGALPPADVIVMAWRGMRVARAAALAGHPVVLAPIKPTYFDYAQSDSPDEPLSIGGPVTLEDVESWEPIPDDWDDAECSKVLGVQGQLWTEFIPDARALDYMLYPRALALAAVAWETHAADTGDRRRRLEAQLPCLAAAGIEYRPAAGVPPWLAGGTGWRKHVNRVPLQHILDVHERAALEGRIPTEDEYDAPLQ